MNALLADSLRKMPILAVLRGISPDEVPTVCGILYDAGITAVEIPVNAPRAAEAVAAAVKYSGGRFPVGVGTILDVGTAGLVADAGASFAVSPNVDTAVIRCAKRLGLLSVPGFFTATEAFSALAAGADFLKFFPAVSGGPDTVRALRSVIPAPIIAFGGVTAGNIAAFLEVCAGVGIGGALYSPDKSTADIRLAAAQLTAAVSGYPAAKVSLC